MIEKATARRGFRWEIAGVVACLLALAILPGIEMSGAVDTAANSCVVAGLVILILRMLYRRSGNRSSMAPRSGGPILVFISLMAGGIFLYLALMVDFDLDGRRNPIFQQAMQLAQNSAVVEGCLGNRIRVGWPVKENSSESASSGNAILAIPVSGNRAKGTLFVIGAESEGTWKIDKMFLILTGETTRHNVIPQEHAAGIAQ